MARSNVEMVEAVVRIIKDLGRDIATVEETKKMLQLTPVSLTTLSFLAKPIYAVKELS